MLQSLVEQVSAVGADALASLSIIAASVWTWVLAQPLWLAVSAAAGIKLIALALIVREWRSKRAKHAGAGKRYGRLTSVAPRGRKAEVIATSSPYRPTPTQSARALVSRGLPEIEISKQTGLARDAVSLLVADRKAPATRQGRPSAAGVAVPATPERVPARFNAVA